MAYFNYYQLIWLSLVLPICALVLDSKSFLRMVKRVRWLLLMLMVVYVFSTPGEYMHAWKLPPRPTYEGVWLGFTQGMRILIMLAGLSIVLATTRRSVLIGGLYQLLLPFKCMGMEAQTFAVRIWLTLNYAEIRQQSASSLRQSLDVHQLFTLSEMAGSPINQEKIAIEIHALKRRDYVLMALIGLYILALGAS